MAIVKGYPPGTPDGHSAVTQDTLIGLLMSDMIKKEKPAFHMNGRFSFYMGACLNIHSCKMPPPIHRKQQNCSTRKVGNRRFPLFRFSYLSFRPIINVAIPHSIPPTGYTIQQILHAVNTNPDTKKIIVARSIIHPHHTLISLLPGSG